MAPLYDLMLLLDTAAPDDRRAKILSDVEAAISAEGGAIESRHDWGPRALAFEINKKTDADYHLFQFTGPVALVDRLRRNLHVIDDVVRFRIIKVTPGTPPPPSLKAEPVPVAAPVGDYAPPAEPGYERPPAAVAAEPVVDEAPGAEPAPPAE